MDGIVPIPLLADPVPNTVRHVEQEHRRVVLTRNGAAVSAVVSVEAPRLARPIGRCWPATGLLRTRRDLDDAV